MSLHHWQLLQIAAIPAIGYFYQSGVSADGELFTIGGRVYELDPIGVAAVGDVAITIANGANAADTIAALVAGINADVGRTVDVRNIGGDVCAIVHRTPGTAGNVALATTGINTTASGAAGVGPLTGGAAESRLSLVPFRYVLTAADVTTLASALGTAQIPIAAFGSTTAPLLFSAGAFSTGGAPISLVDGLIAINQVNANFYVVQYNEPAAGALLAATNVITGIIGVSGQ